MFQVFNFLSVVSFIIFLICVYYFREKIKKIEFNFNKGSLAFELKEFEEDIVNTLLIKQKLLEISSGRWEGPPKKIIEILEILDSEANKKIRKYSGATSFVDNIVQIYKKIDSAGGLTEYQIELDKSFDEFLSYLQNRESQSFLKEKRDTKIT